MPQPHKTQPATASTLTLPSDTEIRITRVFPAPRERAFRAWTDADLLPRWMNPPHCTMTHAEVDLRPGGHFRYTYTTPRGEIQMDGEYVEIKPQERLVFTEGRGQGPGWRTTVEFEDDDGATKVTVTHKMHDMEARDAALASGMQQLWETAWDQLDRTLQAPA